MKPPGIEVAVCRRCQDENVMFEEELERVLPPDVPHRAVLIEKASRHLSLIADANQYMNLTRISNARDAAVKHVLDSVLPWRFFQQAQRVLDAGTGAGFPGIPLAIVLPEVRFTLSESIQKKARFVDSAVEALDLPNVHVSSDRAEALASGKRYNIVTARAVAPVERIYELFSKFVRDGGRLLLFKGPEVSAELAQLRSKYAEAKVIHTYDLPDGLGARTLVAIANHERKPRTAS